MSFETKALLQSHLDYALATKNKGMYIFVANQLTVEGITVKPYNEAIVEYESRQSQD